jgi:hypothetical protein
VVVIMVVEKATEGRVRNRLEDQGVSYCPADSTVTVTATTFTRMHVSSFACDVAAAIHVDVFLVCMLQSR